jgi:hypothetical protein
LKNSRLSNLFAVAKLQISSVRSPCLLQIHYSVVRLRGAGTVDSAFPRCMNKFALLSTVLLNISSRTCNHPHHLSPEQTVICPKFRRECANLSVVKDRVPRFHRGPQLVLQHPPCGGPGLF